MRWLIYGDRMTRRRLVREYGTVSVIVAFVSVTITYVGLAGFRPDDGATLDSRQYLAMANGHEVIKPFRYRLIVPALARVLPGGSSLHGMEIRFGLVDIAALFVAGVALYALLRTWRASGPLALIGVTLFFLSHAVLRFGGIPLVDSAALAALIVAMLAAERGWGIAFLAIVAVGMFVKETTALALIYPLVMANPRRERLRLVALAVPGVVAYATYRLLIAPASAGYGYSPSVWMTNLEHLVTPGGYAVAAWRGLLLGLGPMWLLVVVGLRRNDGLVARRYGWFLLAAALIPALLSTDYERVVFLAFPVALGLGLPTAQRWVGYLPTGQGQPGRLHGSVPST
jgi:hypothetical protein